MMPNIDPRQLKNMMDKMGIKSTEIEALRVIIEGKESNIIIENPQVIAIDAQGSRSFLINGDAHEEEKTVAAISDDDVKTVMEQSGADEEKARTALGESNGDIAGAILKLKGE